jgi:hypothetical protein
LIILLPTIWVTYHWMLHVYHVNTVSLMHVLAIWPAYNVIIFSLSYHISKYLVTDVVLTMLPVYHANAFLLKHILTLLPVCHANSLVSNYVLTNLLVYYINNVTLMYSMSWQCCLSLSLKYSLKVLNVYPCKDLVIEACLDYSAVYHVSFHRSMSGLCFMSTVYTLSLKHMHVLTMLPVHHMLKYLVFDVPDNAACLPYKYFVIEV